MNIDRSNFRSARRSVSPVMPRRVVPVAAQTSRSPIAAPTEPPRPMVAAPEVVTKEELIRFAQHLKRMVETAGQSWALYEHRPFDALVKRMPPSVQRQVAAYRRGALLQRLAFGGIAALIVLSVAIPILSAYITDQRYVLNSATTQLLGPTDSSLVSKITKDSQTGNYYFNKSGIKTDDASPAAALESQVGGSSQSNQSLYSVELPSDPSKGITYYDDNLGLSFSLAPDINLMAPQEEQGRVVYPAGSGMQDVFTTKNNGLKDDIVLTKEGADTESYSYKLNLPDTLQAKMIDGTGEVGIYSADPALYNNITFGDSATKADVMKARVNGAKTNLVFVLPAPTIKEYDAKTKSSVLANAPAHFVLSANGKRLTVDASGLSKLSYPLTIDPSVVTTSSSDFATGNNEGDISYTTGNQINRGTVTGGTLNASGGSWSPTNNLSDTLYGATSVAYNGYIYELGGDDVDGDTDGSSLQSTTYYAPLNSNGTIGSWTPTTALPVAIDGGASVAYNGYIYYLGGQVPASGLPGFSFQDETYYAPLNSNGTIGSWTSTTVLPDAPVFGNAVVYGNFVYDLEGDGDVAYYAPLNADGTIGTWNSTTAPPQNLVNATSLAYNGYIYEMGGQDGTSQSTVYYAPLNSNGTIGSWTSTTSLLTALDSATSVVYNGYIYEIGGEDGGVDQTTVYYAPINANGTIGSWTSTSRLGTAVDLATSVVYNGYVYELGGDIAGTGAQAGSSYVAIDPAGVAATTSWTTSGNAIFHKEGGMCTVAYNGYLYIMGGFDGTTYYGSTQYATLNADGSIGTWTTATNTFTTARTKGVCAAYNGYLYFGAGWSQTTTYYNDFQQSAIGTNGAPGVWSTESNNAPQAAYAASMVANDGYLYFIGGIVSGGTVLTNVYYASVNPTTGATGTWTTATSLNTATAYSSAAVYNNYLYLIAGDTTGGSNVSVIEYAAINTNGSLGGSWTSQSYSPAARQQGGAAIWNGYLYLFGGTDNGSNVYADTDLAPLNANGSIGTWTTTTSITTARYVFGYASYDGYLYVVGGHESGTYASDTQYIALNNGGSGTTGSWTQATNNLSGPYPSYSGMRDSITAGANGFLYVIGGEPNTNVTGGGTATNAVWYAPINADGSPGTWTSTSSMNYSRGAGMAIPYNGYMYVFGGYPSGATPNYDVEYALICTGTNSGVGGCGSTAGTLGTWTLGTSFTNTNMESNIGAVEWNGYFYVMGGNSGGAIASTVDYAPINANGSVGSWTATSNLVNPLNIADQVAVYNGYVYTIGGITTGSTAVGDIEYAQINPSTHALGSFTDIPNALPYTQWYGGDVAVLDGYLYMSNGLGYQQGSSTGRGNTFYAAFGPNGTLGPWQQTSTMPTSHYSSGGTLYNGYLYVVGGYKNSGPTYYPDIEFAPINAIPETGHYSKLIDLGSATNTVYGITYNGSLGANGLANITYKVAGSNGVFGSAGNAFSLIPSTCPTGTATTTTRYVWVNLALDDSGGNFIFPDVDSSSANVTDFTVNYSASIHPTPQTRLRGGQTLKNGTLSPFDTCTP